MFQQLNETKKMVRLTWIEPVAFLFNLLKSLSLFFILDSARHPFVYFYCQDDDLVLLDRSIILLGTFICILMILVQGIYQTIY